MHGKYYRRGSSYQNRYLKWELQYWRNLPIGHSHFRTKITLKITEHTFPTDTSINIHYNDCAYYSQTRRKNSRMNCKNANYSYGINNESTRSQNFQVATYHPIQASAFYLFIRYKKYVTHIFDLQCSNCSQLSLNMGLRDMRDMRECRVWVVRQVSRDYAN